MTYLISNALRLALEQSKVSERSEIESTEFPAYNPTFLGLDMNYLFFGDLMKTGLFFILIGLIRLDLVYCDNFFAHYRSYLRFSCVQKHFRHCSMSPFTKP